MSALSLGLLALAVVDCPARAQSAASSNDLPGSLSGSGSAVSVGGLSGISGAIDHGTPSAQAIDPLYNFGTVFNNGDVSHVFKIRNGGSGTLMIGGVSTSCGCTAAKPTRKAVGPGEESDIAVTLDTRPERGVVTRYVTVFTNDPKRQQLTLTLKGDIKVQVEATPAEVAFGELKQKTEATRRVLISDLVGDKNFKLGSISNSNPNLKVSEAPRTDGKPGAMLTLTVSRTMPVGPFVDTVKVATSRAPVNIVVFGTVEGDLTVSPPQVSFGIVPLHQSALRLVRLSNGSDRPVSVLGLSSSNQAVSAAVEPIKPGKEYKITLHLRAAAMDGTLRGQVAIRTDDARQPTVDIPFYGVIGSFRS